MISQFCAIGVLWGIFTWISFLKYRRNEIRYSLGEVVVLYAVTRFGGILSLQDRTAQILLGLLCDLVIFAFLYLLSQGRERKKRLAVLYIMNPVTILAILSGQIGITVGVALAVLWVLLLRWLLGRDLTNKEWLSLYPAYTVISAAVGVYLFGSVERGETLAASAGGDRLFPVCLILGIAALVAGLIWLVVCLLTMLRRGKEESAEESVQEKAPTEEKLWEVAAPIGEKTRLTKRDFLLMLCLTVMAGALIFLRLGAFYAPESTMEMHPADKTNEIILDFGQEVDIARLDIFLGPKEKRNISISEYDAAQGQWEIFSEEGQIVKSVFCWNEIAINRSLRYMGIVCADNVAYFNEVVILDQEGNRLLPVNAGDYPLLFDEQEKHPEYATYYYRTMYDEVYHGRTAYEFVHDLPIYEISHPPLGKTLISIGVSLFGMTPFGWRCVCALFGTLMVPLLYLFAWQITKKTNYAVLTAGLLSVEFMHMTLSRIATVDIIVAFFIVLMFLFMYNFLSAWRKNLAVTEGEEQPAQRKKCVREELLWCFLCGISTGLAIATKWTGLYAAAGLVVMLAVFMTDLYSHSPKAKHRGRHLVILFFGCLVSFIITPLIIYVLSYLPFTEVEGSKGLLATVIENGEFMLSYHESTVFEHPYSAEWYEWPWVGQPLLDAFENVGNHWVSSVATFGNPVIWLGGLGALLHQCYLWRMENDKTSRFLVLAYISMLAPWFFIHRTVFIYQYFVCAILLVVMLGYSFSKLKKNRNLWALTFLGLSTLLFVLFFTEITGISAPRQYVKLILEWLPSWVFE